MAPLLRRALGLVRAAVAGRGTPSGSAPAPARARTLPRTRSRTSTSGPRTIVYTPHPDGLADPGEVVWTWVAYEDDPAQGKDRPVLVVGRDGATLLALQLSSKDHAGDDDWLALGAGAWDRDGRPSSVRLDRVLTVDPTRVRREGATLDRRRFDLVADALRRSHGWT